ncbi:2-hydroxychromene-2-carboxylate isomerase [Xylophilus rhododendri]|uniref:2-hydroxychromene-2-carboxylate isomerase n=1 Tax=Xylophilus rhododendri TaxID=2697032 RepID=A0A857J7W6_9BURK|nr:DsbA family protein [Xylophilus rhododendri]QHI99323.1 2-hydroxychromene-2-carboxylate isomerase [Xylophilus rhododendri]
MQAFTFHLDFVSPYAYLAFEQLPVALEGCSYAADYRPVLLGAILKQYGHAGPHGIAPKYAWVLRQTRWLAHAHGIAMRMPAVHPFDPLPLLRLALACSQDGGISRHVAGRIFAHVWQADGADANDAQRLAALTRELAPRLDPASPEVKALLRANTARTLEAGVFGVPAFTVGQDMLWGFDALPMLRARLLQDAWFAG